MPNQAHPREADDTLDHHFQRLHAAQKNITPHDELRNGRSVDDALWNGFEKPRGLQRAGLLVYSSFMLLIAFLLIGLAHDQQKPLLNVFALLPIAIAVKVGINAFRPRKKKHLLD